MYCIGTARSEESLLYRLSPVTKLFSGVVLILSGFLLPGSPNGGLIMVVLLLPLLYKAGILIKYLKTLTAFLLSFVIFILTVYTFLLPADSADIAPLWILTVNTEGAYRALSIIQRVAVLMATLLLISMTISPQGLVKDLRSRNCHPSICYIILASCTLIPMVRSRAQAIQQSQKARGLEIEGSLQHRIRSLLPLITPLVISVFSNVEERAAALEVKGFRITGQKTSLYPVEEMHWEAPVRWLCVCLSAAIAGQWLWRQFV
jgi:energy-coupling factor transport system permease protein